MSKYVNVEKIKSYIDAGKFHSPVAPFFSENDVIEMVERYIDGIDIVFCKECKHYRPNFVKSIITGEQRQCTYGECYAQHWDLSQGCLCAEVDEDDFCSYGERRETE